jgi:hypothetical protein
LKRKAPDSIIVYFYQYFDISLFFKEQTVVFTQKKKKKLKKILNKNNFWLKAYQFLRKKTE